MEQGGGWRVHGPLSSGAGTGRCARARTCVRMCGRTCLGVSWKALRLSRTRAESSTRPACSRAHLDARANAHTPRRTDAEDVSVYFRTTRRREHRIVRVRLPHFYDGHANRPVVYYEEEAMTSFKKLGSLQL
eukprot:4276690-Pleurochrysis_carterae.AAC.1